MARLHLSDANTVPRMLRISEQALTFDDVLLLPAHSVVLPKDVDLVTRLTRDIQLNIPLISAAMDTVTESRLAITMAQEGGIGIVHKNMSTEQQANQVRLVKKFESGVIKDPITVGPEDDIEIAAQLFYKHKIGGMPVVEDGRLVGIITESDILRAFIDMMGILSSSARIDIMTSDDPGDLNRAIKIINDQGGDIINVGMTTQVGTQRTYYFRLSPCKIEPIKQALKAEGFRV